MESEKLLVADTEQGRAKASLSQTHDQNDKAGKEYWGVSGKTEALHCALTRVTGARVTMRFEEFIVFSSKSFALWNRPTSGFSNWGVGIRDGSRTSAVNSDWKHGDLTIVNQAANKPVRL